jgi:hypothetical protein
MTTVSQDGDDDAVAAASLATLLEGLREDLRVLFAERKQVPQPRRRSALQRQLLLGLDLMWKIEDQVLLPALHEALPQEAVPAVRQVTGELELMRDLALLATQTNTENREMTLAVLEGLVTLHFVRVGALLGQAPADGADWAALEQDVQGLLGRWRREVRVQGEVEDEDRDPVGLAPR